MSIEDQRVITHITCTILSFFQVFWDIFFWLLFTFEEIVFNTYLKIRYNSLFHYPAEDVVEEVLKCELLFSLKKCYEHLEFYEWFSKWHNEYYLSLESSRAFGTGGNQWPSDTFCICTSACSDKEVAMKEYLIIPISLPWPGHLCFY